MTANEMPPKGRRILALVTDAYGGYGGIAAYNRDVLEALRLDNRVDEIVVLPRSISAPVEGVPEKVVFQMWAARGALSFLLASFREAFLAPRPALIYCAHIHLSPLARALSWLTGAPWVLCLYGVDGWGLSGRWLVDRSAGKADHYVIISHVTLERFRKTWPVHPERCTIVFNAIHAEQFAVGPKKASLEARYGIAGKTVLMTLGRMDPTEQAKGFDRIIALLPRLAATLPNVAYLICGTGGDRPRLERLARDCGVTDRVIFAGGVDEEEKADHYRLADLYVMPSKLEGFGFVFVEALACGVPVVASSIDGGRDAVLQGEIGLVVDPFDSDALLDAIHAGLKAPRVIPEKLSYFSFENFRRRLTKAVGRYLS